MKVLVTGLDGFTGRYVQSELESHGHQVVGLKSDLTDLDALKTEIADVKPQGVIHLAAISFVGHGNSNDFYTVNLLGTRNLLEALEPFKETIQSVLLASSANIYGNRSEGVLSEGSLADPCNDYAVSKSAMEQMACLWMGRLPVFITRPFNYTGIGQAEHFLIPKIVSHFKQKKDVIELGNIDVFRDFGDVRMVARSYRLLLEQAPVGEIINICTGKMHSLKNVIQACEKITGHKIDIQVNPLFVRPNEVRTLVGDNSKLKEFAKESEVYDLTQTLQWMLGE
ncbi:GDP-6-deoxy-D-lyxo-4-hexulose reductase [Terasakiella brassicae]|uniref:GDP-6-deoxy-D-lyxo-4-hexulose reductase n=1 Tax=Terasakiella brassicae TaxID=1634917 RepID=A0A917C6V9_9PROT|nr:GDP-mannose 4,6-dehydratase [Terasakiella brassicae]GGF75135.1 GDP-6-deoxy-D-lyxo-4-hexulose reductase [Terasakiella brassicae]